MSKDKKITYEHSSGNIFKDLGLPNAELEDIKVQEEIAKVKEQKERLK
jgi:hypothetical protein